jgi:K+/H+ antiporter YhaU regulatory subunit KhtT
VSGSPLAGSTLSDTQLRRVTGASVVAVVQDGHITANPPPDTALCEGDVLGLIGTTDELAAAERLLTATTPTGRDPQAIS